jgi:hypothetical protein
VHAAANSPAEVLSGMVLFTVFILAHLAAVLVSFGWL